MKIIFND